MEIFILVSGILILSILIYACNSSKKTNSSFILDILKNDKCFCGSSCSIRCDTGEHYGNKDLIQIEFNCENPSCSTHSLKNWFYCKRNEILFKKLQELKNDKNIHRFTIDRLWTIELPINNN